MKKNACLFLAMFIVVSFGNSAKAADFSTELGKMDIPVGADVAGMGGASTAIPGFSSENPAVIAVKEDSSKVGVTGTYGYMGFKNGLNMDLYSPSFTLLSLPVGVVQLTFSDARSNVATLLDGTSSFQFNKVQSLDLQYGFPVSDSFYLGASYSHSLSEVTMNVFEVGIFNTQSRGNTLGVGAMYRIGKVANLGAYYEHSWDSADDFVDGDFYLNTKTHSSRLRLGASVQITSTTLLAADYQHLYLAGGEKADQYFFGAEQYLAKDFAIYAGCANGGLNAGLGFYLKNGGVNLSYSHRPFREMEEFLGNAKAFMASAYWTF